MPTSYSNLYYKDLNGNRTVFNTTPTANTESNGGYATPEKLMADLGGPIDWSKITYGNTAATSPQAASTPTPAAPNPLQTARDNYISSLTPSSSLTSSRESYLNSFAPTTALDEARKRYLDSLNPDPNVVGAKQKYADFTNSVESGLNRIADKTIPMTFITGQQASLRRNSESTARRLQGDVSLAEENARMAAEKARAGLDFANTDFGTGRERARAALDFAGEDFNTGQKTAETKLGFAESDAEKAAALQKSARDFAALNKVTTPFYMDNTGTVYRTSDGKGYATPEEFFADGGARDFSNAPKISGIVGSSVTNKTSTTTKSGSTPTPTPSKIPSIDQYAQDVFSGSLKLTNVPIKIRDKVSAAVKTLQANQYDSETEARLDYDSLLSQLENEIKNGEQLSSTPTEIIRSLVNRFGKYVSEQEIQATILNILRG